MGVMASRDTEIALIGLALQDYSCAVQASAMAEDAFFDRDTQAVHRAIKRQIARGDAPDLVSTAEECRCDLQEPEQLLIAAMQAGFAPSMYRQYETILLEYRKRRMLYAAAQAIMADVGNPGASVDALHAETLQLLQNADAAQTSMGMNDALMAFIDSLGAGKKGRCATGIADLDRLTGGIRGGKLVVLGARPGVGKTALALYMAVHVARHTGPVLIVSLEMDETEIMSRIVAQEAGVDVQVMESGSLSDEQLARVSGCYGEVVQLPIRISTRATTPLQVRREAVAMQQRQGLCMIVIDYIQLMRGDHKHGSRYEEVSAISRELKLLAMDLGVPVLALTQFNRNSEATQGGKAERRAPTMAEAKDSGSIEQDANLFLIQYPPPEPTEQGDAWEAFHACQQRGWEWQQLIVAKNRQGRTGAINMGFDKGHMRFVSISRG